jgi:sulfur relay (sulfurtransferase) DsrC/TusE family protein
MRNKELITGIKVEGEHAKTVKFISNYYKKYKSIPPKRLIFASIAKDHLKEDKRYYSKLKKAKL